MIEIIFWLSVAALFYTYIGYPAWVALLATLRPKDIVKKDITPRVTMIIPAYNEEKVIRQKIVNSLSLDYPSEKLQIIVTSDCSTDATHNIVSEYADRGVLLLTLPQRCGKTAVQNLAVTRAEGDILVFSDASIMLDKQALRWMMSNYHDATIGCVSGEDRSVSADAEHPVVGEGLYVRYEMLLRRLETKLASIVGASGCFYSARKELCRVLPESVPRDFVTPLEVKERGFRSLSEPLSVAYVRTVTDPRDEFPRRIRTAARGIGGLLYKRHLLNPLHYGLFAIMLLGHKLMRFLVPFFMFTLLITNAFLLTESLYRGFAILQGLFYSLAGIGYLTTNQKRQSKLLRFPYYFVTVNLAILIAWCRWLSGKRDATWAPSKRYKSVVS